ncbi:hypothetical protein PASE110613_16990 [Paenibacillus sediminis]|uniref:Uncharacterized protein n=1 Tax=Paenibacillus sediminis TaxID=664909 RepID=A0ABS4H2Y3_9BACL|nr:hypothetical protein [Paenibacillus sediminis]MBP1936894.1 hypothetical protein [Paenibacillus sediminis]
MSSLSRGLKWLTFAFEAMLAIPVLGGSIVLAFGWAPLVIAFFLHIAAIISLSKDRASAAGNYVGVITSLIAWIPFVGWIMHCVTAVILFIEAISGGRSSTRTYR